MKETYVTARLQINIKPNMKLPCLSQEKQSKKALTKYEMAKTHSRKEEFHAKLSRLKRINQSIRKGRKPIPSQLLKLKIQ